MSDIDCANRTHVCFAACCILGEVWEDDGVTRVKRNDEVCPHLQNDLTCDRYESRPRQCHWDCRRHCSIWIDFERVVPNPDLEDTINGLRLRQKSR